ncbi:thiol-disulfide oxidoreductase DCC family protein [Dyella ginsengisoli]|uniref:thiol-disulfide oxidoreductase DCC family protein n=1 Tax=Dyella ginsengisoli TaxID=363848 RepID=UPI00035C0B06|nr:DCC1-like thiol-disulfide oxidoreductase family protein [Dyella ginsengisoli]
MANEPAVVVFDGVCVLCSRWVDFILRHDRAGRFRLAAMQGRHGRALLAAHGLSPDDPASLLLVADGVGHIDTAAIAGVLQRLDGPWRIPSALLRWFADPAYRWVARHRYRLFGQRDACRMPDPAEAWRFLD